MYYIKSFDGLDLPEYKGLSQYDDRGRGNAQAAYLPTPRGFYRAQGAGVAKRGVQNIVKQCEITAATPALLRAAIEAIAGKLGKESVLIVRWWDDTDRWVWATMTDFSIPSFVGDHSSIIATLAFSTGDQWWKGITENTSNNLMTANISATQTIALNVTETQLRVRDLRITIQPVGAAVTTCGVIMLNGAEPDFGPFYWVTWSESIGIGEKLIIDCGARSIYDHLGVPQAYSSFFSQNKNEWFALDPGVNSIRVTATGNATQNARIIFQYYGHYA